MSNALLCLPPHTPLSVDIIPPSEAQTWRVHNDKFETGTLVLTIACLLMSLFLFYLGLRLRKSS